MIRKYIIYISALVMLFSCKIQEKEQQKKKRITTEDLISANRYLVNQDAATIKEYISRNELKFDETNTGLWFNIEKEGKGEIARKGNIIKLSYDISLLDGKACYSSEKNGPKEFKIGQGGVESGLEEGVLKLKKGSKATFIMPPHLAHGLVGDDGEIPPRAIIIYNVEVLDLK